MDHWELLQARKKNGTPGADMMNYVSPRGKCVIFFPKMKVRGILELHPSFILRKAGYSSNQIQDGEGHLGRCREGTWSLSGGQDGRRASFWVQFGFHWSLICSHAWGFSDQWPGVLATSCQESFKHMRWPHGSQFSWKQQASLGNNPDNCQSSPFLRQLKPLDHSSAAGQSISHGLGGVCHLMLLKAIITLHTHTLTQNVPFVHFGSLVIL